jgi:rhodanese-related sulfurtransferase
MRALTHYILFAAISSVAFLFAPQATAEAAPSISPTELASRQDAGTAPVVIDVRTPEEFALGHMPGALNIPYDQIADRISQVEAPHGVALYCMVGPRARKGEAALAEAGYTSVLHLDGGLAAWISSGFEVEKEQ